MADRSAPELGDLEGTHREPWVPPHGRARTVSLVVLAVAAAALGGFATALLLTDGPGGLWRLLPNLVPLVAVALVSRQGVELGPDGVRRRHGVVRRRWRPWGDVVEVRPAGRWDVWPVAVLDHERLDLRGLASPDAVRLAAALDEARDGRTGATTARG